MTVTVAQPQDRDTVQVLFWKMLEVLKPFGHDVAPTKENAAHWTDTVFMPAAGRGEAVMIARTTAGLPVAAVFWCVSAPNTAFGYGTYVEPEFREQGIGKLIRLKAIEQLKTVGVTRVIGAALPGNVAGHQSLQKLGMKPNCTLYSMEI